MTDQPEPELQPDGLRYVDGAQPFIGLRWPNPKRLTGTVRNDAVIAVRKVPVFDQADVDEALEADPPYEPTAHEFRVELITAAGSFTMLAVSNEDEAERLVAQVTDVLAAQALGHMGGIPHEAALMGLLAECNACHATELVDGPDAAAAWYRKHNCPAAAGSN